MLSVCCFLLLITLVVQVNMIPVCITVTLYRLPVKCVQWHWENSSGCRWELTSLVGPARSCKILSGRGAQPGQYMIDYH